MAENDTRSGMTKGPRFVHGPRSIASLVPVVAREAFRRTGPGVVQLMEAWAGIVGPVLAAATTPRRLKQGTLTIACTGPVAMELQHQCTEVIGRINQYLGSQSVRQLRLEQTVPSQTPVRRNARPTVADEKAVSEAVAVLPEGPLREALTVLGQAVLAESASRLGKQTRTRF
jgi:hypothetical protein